VESKKKNDKKLNVVVVSTLYPNKAVPTRGVFTAHIVENLKKYCDVSVISPLPWFPRNKFFKRFKEWSVFSDVDKKDQYNGVTVYYPRYLVIPGCFAYLHPLFIFFPLYFLMRRLNKQKKVNAIKTHWIFLMGWHLRWLQNY